MRGRPSRETGPDLNKRRELELGNLGKTSDTEGRHGRRVVFATTDLVFEHYGGGAIYTPVFHRPRVKHD